MITKYTMRLIKYPIIFLLTFLSISVLGANKDSLYYICDGGNELWRIDRVSGGITQIGDLGVSNVESMAYWPGTEKIYACDAGNFGTVSKTTGAFSFIANVDGLGSANGSEGPQSLGDIDGMSFDPWTSKLWASNRRTGYDILFQINPNTGYFVPDVFGPGVDYIVIDGSGVFTDIDDIAISPVTGRMFTVSTQGGSAQIVEINKSTGSIVVSASADRGDVEGLAYHNDGTFWGVIGTAEDLVQIDPLTGVTSNTVDIFDNSDCEDPEAISALVADINLVQGQVWDDLDFNASINGAEVGISGVIVNLYYDNNNNGILDGGDFIVQSQTTNGSGDYEFEFATTANLLVDIDESTLPAGYAMTTSNLEGASFTNFGQVDSSNDFGAASGPDSDGDGIPDFYEGTTADTDFDGVLDYLDLDSDNDGILDSEESIADSDNDGTPNYLDLDSDNDGIPDAIEANGGIYPTDYDVTRGKSVGVDTDNDGLLDAFDNAPAVAYGAGSTSNQPVSNTDGDSVADYLDRDSDGDGLMDVVEAGGADANGDGIIDGFADVNGDGYFDGSNINYLPITSTDGDGLPNYIDIDSDGDGIIDTREGFPTNAYPSVVINLDDDGDGIFNTFDVDQGGVPANYEDTDSDGIPDYIDSDSDGDGVADIIEGNDSDFDGVADSSPSGLDADNDGLDDTFDTTPSTWGGVSNVPEQNQDGDSQPDWRDIYDLTNPAIFFFVCDATNELYSINPNTGATPLIGGLGVSDVESIAYWNGVLYAANGGDFGTLNLSTGAYSSIGEIDGGGAANGAAGLQTLNDVDGMSFDPWTGKLWASNRRNGTYDLLFQIDATTGNFVPNAFGAGLDYLIIDGAGVFNDVDDIAVNPADGKLYTVGNDGTNDQLLNINKYTGAITLVDALSENDTEGMAYFNDGNFYGTVGSNPGEFWTIDPADGNMTNEIPLPCGDPEAVAALVAPVNNITGKVWEDLDMNQTINGAEAGYGGVTVNLYYDVNGDGLYDAGDIKLQSAVTDANGDYDFEFATTANLIITVDLSTLPAGYALTTDNVETVVFADNINFGELDANNNFGIVSDADCDGDGIPDFSEGGVGVDSDGDGVDNMCDMDSDNDGILDIEETSVDSDGDGIADFLDLDSDNDGIPDAIEANNGVTPGSYVGNNGYLTGVDADGDGLIDAVDSEPGIPYAGSVSLLDNLDHDQDGIKDYLDLDSDNDGILDVIEAGGTDADANGIIDGFTDGNNNGYGDNLTTNPLPIPNTDGNSSPDYIDLDSDDDGIDDTTEGLSTAAYGTPTTTSDVDGDGIIDFWDTNLGGASIVPVDTDGDGTPDYQDLDSDGDSVSDVIEGNDANGDGIADYTSAGIDSDGDGINDEYDAQCLGNGTGYFSAPTEDGEENASGGTANIGSTDLELIRDGSDQIVGLSYSTLNIPQGEIINAAFIQFTTDETNNANPLTLTITGHDVDNSNVIAATSGNISARTPTTASVTWSPADWNTVGESGPDQKTLDLKAIIQEIVNRPGWTSGNNITILITGTSGGRRTAESNNGSGGPTLSISFGTAGTWGCATNTPHQDFNSDGEDDWRDIDDDGDGINTFDETADLDGNGTPDYLEIAPCPVGQTSVQISGNADVTIDFNNIALGSGNAIGALDNNEVRFNNNNSSRIDLDFTDVLATGSTFDVRWRKVSGSGNSQLRVYWSATGTGGWNQITTLSTSSNSFITSSVTVTTAARYFRFERRRRVPGLDGITYNIVSCEDDFDMDGIPNTIDEDDDNDGIPDVVEGLVDTDGDGQIDALDLDSDNDGIVDAIEANGGSLPANMNNEGQYSAAFVIANGGANGWLESTETGGASYANGSTPLDSDLDGVQDRIDLDSDNDGIVDAVEANTGVLPANMNTNGQYPVAYATANDSDGDGIVDDVDSDNGGTILANPDTDGDGMPNYLDLDSDGDSVSDNLEGFNPDVIIIDINDDADGDGINDVFDTDNGGAFANLPDEDCNLIADYLDIIKNTAGSGAYTFASTWVTGTVPSAGRSVIVTTGHTLNLTGNVTIGSLYIKPGAVFNLNGYNLTILGYFEAGGTFNHGGGKVFLSGSCTQTVCGNAVFYDLEVNNSNGVNMDCGNISVANELTLTDGIMSTCGANSFTMESTSSGTAYIASSGTGTVICDVTFERYKEGCADGWMSLGSPFATNTLNDWDNDIVTAGFPGSDWPSFSFVSVYSYDETPAGIHDIGWTQPNSINDAIIRGKGYYVYEGTANYPLTLDVTGVPNLNTFTFPVNYTSNGSPANDGWNLLANPYPSAIEWDLTNSSKWINVGCCDATYIWNECVDQFASYISSVGTNGGSNVIPSSSAFWIKSHFPGASLKCTREAMAPDYGDFRSGPAANVDAVMTLHIDGFSREDEVKFRVLSTASHGHDDFGDALKVISD